MGDDYTLKPCSEFIDIGPFRFECAGHDLPLVDRERIARKYHGGKLTHHALSPGDVGDVDVTFWTALEAAASGSSAGDDA